MDRLEFIRQVDLFISYLEMCKTTNAPGEVEFNIAKNQLNALNLFKYGLIYNPRIVEKLGLPEQEVINTYKNYPDSYFSKMLNESQKDAVIKALNMNDILVVQGPPGTGKTTVIAEMIMQLKKKEPHARFLITSASHLAVDNIIEALEKNNFKLPTIRIKSVEKRKEIQKFEVENYLSNYFDSFKGSDLLKSELQDYFEKNTTSEIKNITKNFDLVAVTLNAIVGVHFDISKPFDYVIIDEVAKSTLPEVCPSLIYAKKAIFIGDNKQLSPIIQSDSEIEDKDTRYLGENSYIEYLFTHIDNSSRAFLNKQFRMSNDIGSFISDEFYQNPKLYNGRNNPNKDGLNYVTYDLPRGSNSFIASSNKKNEIEGDIIEAIIPLLPKDKKIAIISPYKEQVNYLKKRFGDKDIKIGTVDSFQGQGIGIVLCTICRNAGSAYFISNPNRVNVAISRAEEQFWLIGYKDYLEKIELFDHYYNYSKNGKKVVNAYYYNSKLIKK